MLAGPKAGVRRMAVAVVAFSVCAAIFGNVPAAAAASPITVAAAGGACGNVEIGTTGSKDVLAAENCFSGAYSTCDAAMFSVAYHGGDAGVARTFETMRSANSDGCEVAEIIDHYKGANVASSDTYLCSDVKQGADGLTFMRCGADGDVFVPADLSSPNAKKLLTVAYTFKLSA